MTRRFRVMLFVLMPLALLAAVWGYFFMDRNRVEAMAAAEDLSECYAMSPQIESFSKLPTLAADQERMEGETTGLIEEAAKASNVPKNSLLRIDPTESSQRLGDSVYKEKPTQIVLKDVTLKQLIEMLHKLASGERGLYPKSLRITAPSRDDTGSVWAAEVTVSYLIYEPIRTQEGGSSK